MQTSRLAAHRLSQIRHLSSSSVLLKVVYRSVEQVLTDGGYRKLFPEKMMYKLLFRDKKQNPFFVNPPVAKPSISIETAAASVYTNRIAQSKRVRVLNKLFMRYVPEVLATSAVGEPLIKYNVQFSGVKVGHQYNKIDVFWVPKGTDEDEIIQELLNQAAYPLRSELINLRLMGLLPPIRFKKDKRIAFMKELERRLRIADYGEDYIPSFHNECALKNDLQLDIQLPKELREKIMLLDRKDKITEDEERDIPVMISNTLGLNYDRIVNTILQAKNKHNLHKASTESLIGESAIKSVPFSFEAQPMQSWNRKVVTEYIKSQRAKQKLIIKTKNREYSDERRSAARTSLVENENEENNEYIEFVQNAFPDIVEDVCKDDFNERSEYEQ